MPINIKNGRILVTNDDGFGRAGLKLLIDIAKSISREVWVVAPSDESSGAGHSITVRRPLLVSKINNQTYTVDGTPTDCIMIALNELMKKTPPDLVLSGINQGLNIAEDISYSGTVGAAIEATIMGFPSIALSQEFCEKSSDPWEVAKNNAGILIDKICSQVWENDSLININFPRYEASSGDFEITEQGRQKKGDNITVIESDSGKKFYKIGAVRFQQNNNNTGSDARAIKAGIISITPISIRFTNQEFRERLATKMKEAVVD